MYEMIKTFNDATLADLERARTLGKDGHLLEAMQEAEKSVELAQKIAAWHFQQAHSVGYCLEELAQVLGRDAEDVFSDYQGRRTVVGQFVDVDV